MATSHFFIQPDQRNTNLVDNSNEIRTETQKSRGRKPAAGSKKNQPELKKQRQRGMGVAHLERVRIEEEKKQILQNPNPNSFFFPVPLSDAVLQGFPSYVGGGCRSRLCCGGGGGWSGPIMIDPVCNSSPCGFVENSSTHGGLSSIPNPQVYNNSYNHPCDICFKKKRLDGDNISSPMDHLLQQDQRSKSQTGFVCDHVVPKSVSTNHTEGFEGNPSNGLGGRVKEYEFFPTKFDGETVSVATSVGDCSPNSSTIDLTLKL